MVAASGKKEKAQDPKRVRKKVPLTEFRLYAPEAGEIFLAGDFNNWEANSVNFRMRRYKGGGWKKKVALEPGCYEYRFVVDGAWWTDPENPERSCTPYGSENSVITVTI